MICQFRFQVSAPDGERLPSSRAYALYSFLLSLLPEEYAAFLHEQGETPLSQFLYRDRESGRTVWVVTLFGADAVECIAPVLAELKEATLHTGVYPLTLLERRQFDTPHAFLLAAVESPCPQRMTLQLATPVSFRQNHRYVILPQERLLLQSLLNKWNAVFPTYPLEDEDAIRLLEEGVHLVDYSLRTTRYPLKGTKIPGFSGTLVIEARLAPPIFALWNLLIHFSVYSGIGVKTTLGMGGVSGIE